MPKRTRPGSTSSGLQGITELTDVQAWGAASGRLDSITHTEKGKIPGQKGGDPINVNLKTVQSFVYDGAGRLVKSTFGKDLNNPNTARLAPSVSTYGYDVDDALVYETGPGLKTYRFQGFRREKNTDTGVVDVLEKLTPAVSARNGNLVWSFVEPDGHALATYDSAGRQLSFDVLGAYGGSISRSGPTTWPVDGFHGSDPDRADGVVPFGVRHMLARGDGTWMQPEPLLYVDPTRGDLSEPLGYSGVYARGNPLAFSDTTGLTTLADLYVGAEAYRIKVEAAYRTVQVKTGTFPLPQKPFVTATFEQGATRSSNGGSYTDINPTSRGLTGTPERERGELPGLSRTNGDRWDMHADVGAMVQSADAGNKGGSGRLVVDGEAICPFCQNDIKTVASDYLDLSSLEVVNKHDDMTEYYVFPDRDSLRPVTEDGGMSWEEASGTPP